MQMLSVSQVAPEVVDRPKEEDRDVHLSGSVCFLLVTTLVRLLWKKLHRRGQHHPPPSRPETEDPSWLVKMVWRFLEQLYTLNKHGISFACVSHFSKYVSKGTDLNAFSMIIQGAQYLNVAEYVLEVYNLLIMSRQRIVYSNRTHEWAYPAQVQTGPSLLGVGNLETCIAVRCMCSAPRICLHW